MLLNPNFVINQRLETAYTSEGYTVDKWYLFSEDANNFTGRAAYNANNRYLAFTSTNSTYYASLAQKLENTSNEFIKNQSLTLYCNVTRTHIASTGTMSIFLYGRINGSSPYQTVKLGEKSISSGAFSLTVNTGDYEEISYIVVKFTTNTQLLLVNCKLEINSEFSGYEEVNELEEVKKCQSYYFNPAYLSQEGSSFIPIGSGSIINGNFSVVCNLPSILNKAPTITFDYTKVKLRCDNVDYNVATQSSMIYNRNNVFCVNGTISDNTVNSPCIMVLTGTGIPLAINADVSPTYIRG